MVWGGKASLSTSPVPDGVPDGWTRPPRLPLVCSARSEAEASSSRRVLLSPGWRPRSRCSKRRWRCRSRLESTPESWGGQTAPGSSGGSLPWGRCSASLSVKKKEGKYNKRKHGHDTTVQHLNAWRRHMYTDRNYSGMLIRGIACVDMVFHVHSIAPPIE